MLNKELLNILVCPLCKGRLLYDAQQNQLICLIDHLVYKIKDGIPIIIPDKAIKLNGE